MPGSYLSIVLALGVGLVIIAVYHHWSITFDYLFKDKNSRAAEFWP
jgi:hypothetical protein